LSAPWNIVTPIVQMSQFFLKKKATLTDWFKYLYIKHTTMGLQQQPKVHFIE